MPVVVNEFEVVSESEPPVGQAAEGQRVAEPAAAPPDVERVIAERRARERRVRAY